MIGRAALILGVVLASYAIGVALAVRQFLDDTASAVGTG